MSTLPIDGEADPVRQAILAAMNRLLAETRHLPAVGVTPAASGSTPYLVVKQDNNGDTFVVTARDAPWVAAGSAACCRVTPWDVGGWTHPTREDIQSQTGEISVQRRRLARVLTGRGGQGRRVAGLWLPVVENV